MSDSPDRPLNRLARETSPYLRQHARNPVDWYPWGEEAIARARAEGKPIFLSIGYSACHWCHVMERECFENDSVAAILNERFVSIKVDREERPDLDDIYMQAVQMMTGGGGWPMSVFLDTELRPFFGGTYFPPDDRGRHAGFKTILLSISETWRRDPAAVREASEDILRSMRDQESMVVAEGDAKLTTAMLDRAVRGLRSRFDSTYGGFGPAPKFPPSMALELLLLERRRTGDPELLPMIETTLDRMALGGMYDQLGGGFHRYSTDHKWLVPHFEKMLYDEALLAPVYFDAWLATGKPYYERVGRETLDYLLRDMTSPEGAIYSTEDADSEGEEGRFYVWSRAEIDAALGSGPGGAADAELFRAYFQVTDHGNFEGHNILEAACTTEEYARREGLDHADFARRLDAARARLLEVRSKRVRPHRDEKILSGWNGMAIVALAKGARATGDARYREAADRAADFVLDRMRDPATGGLLRTWGGVPGSAAGAGEAKIPAFLEDYAFMTTALLDLYETTFEPRRLEAAADLADRMLKLFRDEQGGGFFTNDGADPSVIVRRKEMYDGATPSGNSQAARALTRLAILLDRPAYREAATSVFAAAAKWLERQPQAVHRLLCVASFALDRPYEIAIAGDPADPATRALLDVVERRYVPHRVVACATAEAIADGLGARIPLLRDKTALDGKPTAYVCFGYACQKPTTTPEELAGQLK